MMLVDPDVAIRLMLVFLAMIVFVLYRAVREDGQ